MNKTFISGRLTRDIEKKTSANGTEYVKFSVAVSKYVSKTKENKTIYVDCMAFSHNANYLAKYCINSNLVSMENSGEKIIKINIEEEMKSSYIDYSMSVIVSRALPDVRDGLKPVHRRVLFGMDELGLTSGKPYKKSDVLTAYLLKDKEKSLVKK